MVFEKVTHKYLRRQIYLGSVSYKTVTTCGQFIFEPSRNGINIPSLIQCHINGNKSPASCSCFNNNDRYANGKDKLFVGLDSAGQPTRDYTKVAAADGKAGVDYQMLAIRFEIDF